MKRFIGLLLLVCSRPLLAQKADSIRVETMPNVIVGSTRTNRLLKNTPVTMQVIDREDIDEGTGQSPANIRELLTELSGTQMQQTSAVSGNVAIRLLGLDGRYTQLLKDGFPMYGGFSGSLSILQVPPLDLRQVEVIKGAGSALYGGDAIAGIINLISRTPDSIRHWDGIVNHTSRNGTDLGEYFSQRWKRFGMTVMGTGSWQQPVDVNKDGFTDLPRVRQGSIAPTLFWYPDDSTTIRFGVSVGSESRNGGDIRAVENGVDSVHPFLQQNRSNRDYYQLSVLRKGSDGRSFSLKNSVGYFYRSITQSTGIGVTGFSGGEVSSYTEASYSLARGRHVWVGGASFITDAFRVASGMRGLGYTHNTAGLFVQDDWNLGQKMVLETGVRGDVERRVYLLPRVALLYKPVHGLAVRLGGGLAYKLPTVFNASDEEDAYQQVYPIASSVRAERSASANLSMNYQGVIGEEIGFGVEENLYYTRLTDALVPQTDSLQRGWLYYLNAPGPVVSRGAETNLRLRLDELSLQLGYTYTDARREYLPGKPMLPLTPRNRFVGGVSYEVEPHWKAGVEGFYTGSQVLDNGQAGRDFWTVDLTVQRSWGPVSLLLNVENLGDVRQSRFGALYTGTMKEPVFGEVYAPLEGRVVSVAMRYRI